MRLGITALGLAVAVALPQMAAAEAKIYPYHGQNFCPDGLQPVQINGVICCGQPNQSVSYSQVMAHPAPQKKHRVHRHARKHRHVYSARAHCPVGAKGCS